MGCSGVLLVDLKLLGTVGGTQLLAMRREARLTRLDSSRVAGNSSQPQARKHMQAVATTNAALAAAGFPESLSGTEPATLASQAVNTCMLLLRRIKSYTAHEAHLLRELNSSEDARRAAHTSAQALRREHQAICAAKAENEKAHATIATREAQHQHQANRREREYARLQRLTAASHRELRGAQNITISQTLAPVEPPAKGAADDGDDEAVDATVRALEASLHAAKQREAHHLVLLVRQRDHVQQLGPPPPCVLAGPPPRLRSLDMILDRRHRRGACAAWWAARGRRGPTSTP